ncbi:MAG: hypothetical protein ABI759_20760 [Candidatus Solibacter sp.]
MSVTPSILLALFVSCCAAAPAPGSLTAALNERDLGKRSKLALDNANLTIKEMREAGNKGDAASMASLVKEFEDSIALCWDSLESTGKNPRKSPKWFKQAEIETRNLLKKLNSLQEGLPFEERPILEKAKARLQQVHDDLLVGLMEGKK